MKNLMKAIGILTLLSLALTAHANEEAEKDESKCVMREVVVLVKSTRGVIYEEKDEGKLISKYMVKDCGDKIVVDKTTQTPIGVINNGQIKCPPNVQDCIRP